MTVTPDSPAPGPSADAPETEPAEPRPRRDAKATGRRLLDAAAAKTREVLDDSRAEPKRRETPRRRVIRWARRVLYVTMIGLVVYALWRFDNLKLPDDYAGMQPSYWGGQSLIVDTFPGRFASVAEALPDGDVILYEAVIWDNQGTGSYRPRVARIAARPGARIGMRLRPPTTAGTSAPDGAPTGETWVLTINDRVPASPSGRPVGFTVVPVDFARALRTTTSVLEGPGLVVPAEHLFVLEDNVEPNAPVWDSRQQGFVPYDRLLGRVAMAWGTDRRPGE